jgi:hypothetical protein
VILVYAISQAPAVGWTAFRTLAMLVASAVLLAAFVVIESRAQAPLLPLRLFRLRTLVGSNTVGFLLGVSFYGYIFIGTLYMQQVLGYSALKTGLAWLAVGLTGVVLAGPAQLLATRASAKLVMVAGMTVTGAGIVWATQVPVHGNFWADLAGPFFLTGAVTWAFIPHRSECCMSSGGYPPRWHCPMGPWLTGCAEPRRAPRFHPCSPTCSCITRLVRAHLV